MNFLSYFPALNASLNGLAAIFLIRGYFQIKAGRKQQHKNSMVTAFAISIVFLICYLIYHLQVGSVKFEKTGFIRTVYFTILVSHILLAFSVPFLSLITLRRGLRNDLRRHVNLAKWTFPIWLYVSVTGVIVYFMLYHL
jgi:uncharacterized membrane protein YozB (DUF420 family)